MSTFDKKLQHSIELLKKSQELALRYNKDGFFLAFSGDKDVWHFLNDVVKVKHCSLYDEGFHRIGCLFCPMSNIKSINREIHRYPKYYDMMIRTIHKIRAGGV